MIRKAKIKDIEQIHNLINYFAQKDLMLARSMNELYEHLRDFWVYEKDKKIIATSALHIAWEDLVEIKALTVDVNYQGKGIGTKLVETCVKEAKELGAKRVFALTYNTKFFSGLGFKVIEHTRLPHKIWAECIKCPKFPDCKEIAMIKNI